MSKMQERARWIDAEFDRETAFGGDARFELRERLDVIAAFGQQHRLLVRAHCGLLVHPISNIVTPPPPSFGFP